METDARRKKICSCCEVFCGRAYSTDLIRYILSANKLFFGKQSVLEDHPPFTWQKNECTYFIKDSAGNIPTDKNEILSGWREYFEDLLCSVKASTNGTHEVTHLGKEDVFTAAEEATAIKGIKSGKAAGADEIKPEMLKALTGEGILWLTRVCQLCRSLERLPEIGKQM